MTIGSGAERENLAETVRHLERCRACQHAMPLPPAPRVCTNCKSKKLTPHYSEWPKSLKSFLLIQFALNYLFYPWRPKQESWELLLMGNYDGKRFPNNNVIPRGANPDLLYAMAVEDAQTWRAGGAKADFF